jgi:hypothetical protein
MAKAAVAMAIRIAVELMAEPATTAGRETPSGAVATTAGVGPCE